VKTTSGKAGSGTVTLQKRPASGGTWTAWKTATLKSNGSYVLSVKMTGAQVSQVRARKSANAANQTGFSASRKITVEALQVGAAPGVETEIIGLVNQERAARGLAPVGFDASLTSAACAHSSEMAQRGVLTHLSANGATVAERLIRHGYVRDGYTSWGVGENVACASSGTLFATPQAIVMGWMDSSAHRQVILGDKFRDAGVGVATSATGVRYYTLDMGGRSR
jgi:uncharacterized protein YkwD